MRKKEETQSTGNTPDQQPTFVVGIGASAGGVEALTQFFGQVSADSGLAYVVILHLSPDYDSQLAQILQQVAPIPVSQVTKAVRVEANQVYVVPPDKQLHIQDGTIAVRSPARLEERRAPVDIFLRSLAESHGPLAIAVILSGTGANGSMGLKRVKEKGGAVFVQNSREAAFNEMPRHAIATDLIDDILPVAQIPARLLTYIQGLGTVSIPEEAPQRPEEQQQALREVFTQLRLRTGHDFSNYKRSTLLRRVERRISIHNLTSLPAYAAFLREHTEETQALLKDLLISVTNFFRDESVFHHIEQQVLPALIRRGQETLRIWVAGCATGEEAYSLAILCAEQTMGSIDAPKVQIFATDIDEDAIATAREGLYTLNDAADVSAERLSRFFTKEGEAYRVRREIREMILFAHQNVLKDPPFSKLDMVTCRNLLIYLNSIAQERVMETFHFALNPGGYLLLGLSETVDGSGDLYVAVSREHHLYQSRQVASRPYPVPESISPLPQLRKRSPEPASDLENRPVPRLSFGELHQQLLEQYAPPSIIVNEDYDILHFTSRAGRYLHFAGGEPTKNLLRLIRPEFRLELRTALYQATQQQTNVEVRNLRFRLEELTETLTLHVRPVLGEGEPAQGFILVLFELIGDGVDDSAPVLTPVEPMARQLEDEVIRVKAQLRSANEHHELQAEELKASNEELQAMNEELRSAAEELETGKEELQSINEELITVNQELKIKVEEISITSNNLQNLINSTDIATLFLDRSLRVNLFTPAARQLFNLIPTDFGRPLTDITNRLDDQRLLADAGRVLATLQPIEREIRTTDGSTFIMRVLPYRTANDHINGVVITFVDITERKASAEALRESEEQFRLFVTTSSDTIYKMSADWRQMLHLKGGNFLADTNAPSTSWLERYILPEDRPNVEKAIQKAIQGRQTFEMEHRVIQADGSIGWTFSRAVPVLDEQGQIREWFGAASDITPRKRAQESLHQSEERQAFLLKLSDALRPLSDSVDIQATVTRTAMDYFGADRSYYAEIEGDLVTIRRDASRPDLPSVANTYSLSQIPLFNAVSQKGLPIIVPDVNTSDVMDEELRQLCIAMSIIAYINVPVIKNGQLVGQFCLTQRTQRDWTTTEVEQAQEIAERTWAAVERTRAEIALRQSEERQVLLLRLSDALRMMSNPADIQHRAMQMLGEYLGLSRAYYFRVERNDDGWVHNIESAYQQDPNQPSMIGRHSLKPFGSWLFEGFDRGEAVAVSDVGSVSALSPEELALYRAIGVTAFINVPLLRDGRYSAGIAVHDAAPHAWTPDEIGLIREVAARTWVSVQRASAEEALRQSEEKYRTLFNSIDEGFCIFEIIYDKTGKAVDYRYQEVNQAFERQTGLKDAPGKLGSEIAPNTESYWLETYDQVMRTGQPLRMENYNRATGRWYDAYASRIDGADSHLICTVFNDITERKQREENQAFLADLGEDFARLASSSEIMPVVGEKLYTYYGLTRVVFAYLNEDATVATVVYDRHEPDLPSALGDHSLVQLLGDGFQQIVQDSRVVVVNDITTDLQRAATPHIYQSFGLQAQVVAPYVSEGQWCFIISVQKSEPYRWRTDQIELLEILVPRLYLALERQRFERLRQLTLLQQTEELAKIGSWDFNQQTGKFSWSNGMYKLFSIELGQTIQPEIYLEFAVEEDKAKAQRLVSFLRRGKKQFETDFRIRVGKQLKTLRIKANVIREGGQKRVLGVDLDISDQLAAQRQIQETAVNLQAVLDGSPAAIGLLKTIRDPADAERIIDFELTVGNRKLAQFFKQPLKKLLGQSATRFSRLLWDGQTLDILRQVRLTNEARYDEQRLSNEGRWLAIATTRQDDGVLITALDITELKGIQEQQQQWLNDVENSRQSVDALSELRESLHHRSELLRAVSHDLRGNFGIISSALQLLNMAASEADRAQMMEMVLRNVRQATGLLTELLDYSRLEAGQEERSVDRFDVAPLLRELGQSLRPAAEGQGLQVESAGPETLVVESDRLHVHRMAQNLIINAIKYTHAGKITVNWGSNTEQARWWFSVDDTGPGIDAELVDFLNTNRESTGTSTPGTSTPGTGWTTLRGEGIGLRIVRQLAYLLEARLTVSSQVGVGTRFVVHFPLHYD